MLKDYETALKYCKLILQYEPNNATAKEFYPLILEKLRHTYETNDPYSSSEEEEDEPCVTGSSSSSNSISEDSASGEEGEDGEGSSDEKDPADKRTSSDGDATTASYSSLEDEEADQLNNLAAKFRVDNVDLGNGNKIICDTSGSKIWEVNNDTTTMTLPFGTSSDSESPTEPVSQQTIANLRAKVVPSFRH